jgi:hypothetical protein
VPGIGAGFALLWALAWRKQARAVTIVEDHDGAQFYVKKTSLFRSIKLLRAPGLHREHPRSGD